MNNALSGVTVIDYGNLIAAPFCSKLLADLGAKVIKIEPLEGEICRMRAPFVKNIPGKERSCLFQYLNTNKCGITLNLDKEAGKNIFKELVKKADILIEDTKPGWLDKKDIGYEALKSINESLIMTSITGFGQTGPYKDYQGSDLLYWSIGGPGYVTPLFVGTTEQEPLRVGRMASFVTGMTAAVATMCALRVQRHTGIGQRVDTSAFESMVTLAGVVPLYWSYARRNATRASRYENSPVGYLRCKDGWISTNSWQQWQWERLVEAMGSPEWVREELFKDGASRAEHWESLKQLLEEWTTQHTKSELFEIAKEKRIPLAPVNSMAEVATSRQLRARNFFEQCKHEYLGTLEFPGAPYKLSETPWSIRNRAPLLGEHNEQVYCNDLGYSKEEIEKLYQTGII